MESVVETISRGSVEQFGGTDAESCHEHRVDDDAESETGRERGLLVGDVVRQRFGGRDGRVTAILSGDVTVNWGNDYNWYHKREQLEVASLGAVAARSWLAADLLGPGDVPRSACAWGPRPFARLPAPVRDGGGMRPQRSGDA